MIIAINLLQNQKNYRKLEETFRFFRVGTVLFGFIAFVCLIMIFAMNYYAQNSLHQAEKQKAELVDLIQRMEDKEAQILLIQEKMKAMNDIIRATPDYAQQFETFYAFMPVATSSGELATILLDQNSAQAKLKFPGITALSSFLATTDSPVFQKTFQEAEIGSISYSDPQKELDVNMYVGFKKPNN